MHTLTLIICATLAWESHGAEASTATQISVRVIFDNVTVQTNSENATRFTGAEIAGEPGLPGLPSVVIRVLLPPDANLLSAVAQIEDAVIENVPGKWNVPPYPPAATVGGKPVWPADAEIKDGLNVRAYSTSEYQPSSFLGLVKGHPLHEWKILLTRIYPFRYNPVTKQMQRLTTCSLKVSFNKDPSGSRLKAGSSPAEERTRQRVRTSVINFDSVADQYR